MIVKTPAANLFAHSQHFRGCVRICHLPEHAVEDAEMAVDDHPLARIAHFDHRTFPVDEQTRRPKERASPYTLALDFRIECKCR
jgi:hypothetical protein